MMEVTQITQLIEAIAKNGITELSLEEEGTVLTIKKENRAEVVLAKTPQPEPGNVPEPAAQAVDHVDAAEKKWICAPLVGTFYAASAPGEAPYVKVGDSVKKGQVLGVIEAMKLMNEIEAECDGIIKEVLITDGNLVEYGQKLFVIE